MKVALFSDTFEPQINGVANTVKNSARALSEQGHEVCVYTISKESGKKLTEKSGCAYEVVNLPSVAVPVYPGERFYPPLGFTLSSLRKWKPDIIHVHTPFSVGLEGVLCAKLFKVPIVGTHHTFYDHYLKHVYIDYEWARKLSWSSTVAFYNRMDTVISPTASLRDELITHGLKKPVFMLANSINFQVFKNNLKKDLPSKKKLKKIFGISGKSIVYMGRVSYEKSIDDVIKATSAIIKKIPEVKLMIIGDGPEKEKLIKLSEDLKVKDSVIFTGFLQGESLVQALSANDVFVTASRSENMPLAVLEAMSVGLPIVSVSSLGMSEIIEHNKNGYLLSLGEGEKIVESIAEAVLKLLLNNSHRNKFCTHALKHSKKYSEKEITNKLADIYKMVIDRKNEDPSLLKTI